MNIATITVSDSRTPATDRSGPVLRSALEAAGFSLAPHLLLPDDLVELTRAGETLAGSHNVDVIVSTGGTGIGPRDITPEALARFIDKPLPGFQEAFGRLSWQQVGHRALLSRALAGAGHDKLWFLLPGSPKAVELALKELIVPVLPHALAMLRGGTHGGS